MASVVNLLLVAYEFADPIFSGNGTCGRSVAEGICLAAEAAGIAVDLDVITAVPVLDNDRKQFEDADESFFVRPYTQFSSLRRSKVRMLTVPVATSRWRRLDLGCNWEAFGSRAAALYGMLVRTRTPPASPSARAAPYSGILCVDWHGFYALQQMLGGVDEVVARSRFGVPIAFCNFRVFANPVVLHGPTRQEEFAHYLVLEAAATLACSTTVALCAADRNLLIQNSSDIAELERADALWSRGVSILPMPFVVCGELAPRPDAVFAALPPVRSEVIAAAELAWSIGAEAYMAQNLPSLLRPAIGLRSPTEGSHLLNATDGVPQAERAKFLVCCVRQAEDKNPLRFVELVEHLVAVGRLPNDVTPVFFGSVPDEDYSALLRRRLERACPRTVVLRQFVSPRELVAIFLSTILNVHPCLYDAYGLTVVEAAVCRCPSIVHQPNGAPHSPVGVMDLLHRRVAGPLGSANASHRAPTTGGDSDHDPRLSPAAFLVDVTDDDAFFALVARLLRNDVETERERSDVAKRAQSIAVGHDTTAYGKTLCQLALPGVLPLTCDALK